MNKKIIFLLNLFFLLLFIIFLGVFIFVEPEKNILVILSFHNWVSRVGNQLVLFL